MKAKFVLLAVFLFCLACAEPAPRWMIGEWEYDIETASQEWNKAEDADANAMWLKRRREEFEREFPTVAVSERESRFTTFTGTDIFKHSFEFQSDNMTVVYTHSTNYSTRQIVKRTDKGFCLFGTLEIEKWQEKYNNGEIQEQKIHDTPSHPWRVDCYKRPTT